MVQAWIRRRPNLLDAHRFRRPQFNYSEIVGNSAAVALSNSYCAHNRTAHDAAEKLGVQIGWIWRPTSSKNSGRICNADFAVGTKSIRSRI
jgi:hypothetical protein